MMLPFMQRVSKKLIGTCGEGGAHSQNLLKQWQERCLWVMTILVKRGSNVGQVIELGMSDGRRVKFLPSVVGSAYNWLQIEGHLGNDR